MSVLGGNPRHDLGSANREPAADAMLRIGGSSLWVDEWWARGCDPRCGDREGCTPRDVLAPSNLTVSIENCRRNCHPRPGAINDLTQEIVLAERTSGELEPVHLVSHLWFVKFANWFEKQKGRPSWIALAWRAICPVDLGCTPHSEG